MSNHGDRARSIGLAVCQSCHGADYRGTVLSRAQGDRTFTTKTSYGSPKRFYRGQEIGCYECHNGPGSSDPSTRTRPVVSNATLNVPAGQSGSLTLSATGAGSKIRIVRQPAHGSVALSGFVATYLPEEGFIGPDSFVFTASDASSYVDATTPATVAVTVGDPASLADLDRDGDGLSDFVEYALGLSPDFPSTNSAVAPMLEVTNGQTYLTLSLSRSAPPPDVTLSAEVTSDLTTWQPAAIVTNTNSLFKVRDTAPMSGNSKRFIRLRVSR